MRKGAKANLEQRLRALADQASKAADDLRDSKDGPPFAFSVGWGNAPEAIIRIDDRPAHRRDVEEMADSAIWALFESCRDGGDPRDPKAFSRVMDRINAEARKRCHQTNVPSNTEGEP